METTRVPCTLDYTSEETGLAGGSCLHKLLLDGAEDRVAAHTIQPSIAFLIVRTILWREMGAISNEIECPLSLNACQLLSRWTGVRQCHQIRCYLRPGVAIGPFGPIFRLRDCLLSCKCNLKLS